MVATCRATHSARLAHFIRNTAGQSPSIAHLTNFDLRLQAAPTEIKFTMEDMIKDAIKNDKENVRGGVSQPANKKYLAFRFKGASGKVKLAKPVKPVSEVKEPKPAPKAAKPASKPVAKKPAAEKVKAPAAAKKVTKKVPTAPTKKVAAAKASTGKKTSSTTKKVKAAAMKS
ncbi:hypothetical protein PtA15_14A391 [Puccinia triticina]|uniref:H15 domain-containing protein n=1 Tax=Puccinia triticina TaxID=208348 RepID=A0ABY7D492_9BASI|nr:uncharacterized protein PtA15_14A386 [Puccinia triticina]XP_053027062.1 uncharacterized protein PtA15_14A391 [Puccinia triticina]WAQ91502.1 hypothetical protein PtA15_14A386 [Puccinia triticina]WAQ91507.1 hypothetical protein PtA15_14A391 [Puccinia triticina]